MKKILMLGGARSQIPAIQKAKELGLYVITCDYLPDNPGHQFSDEYQNISTVEKEQVLEYARFKQIDGILAYASDPSAPAAAYVSEKLALSGSSYQSVHMLSRKDLFREFQKKHGFWTPSFFCIRNVEELKKLEHKITYPCMVKPVDSSGSKGVYQADCCEQLREAYERAVSFSRCGRMIVEEYIDTPYHQLHGDGVVSDGKLQFIALGDQRFLHSVPIGTSLPSKMSCDMLEKVYEEVSRLVLSSGFQCGGINVEVRVTQAGEIYIIEMGPRCGGNYVPQLMEAATGEDELTAVVQIAMGMPAKIRQPKQIKCCLQYIIGSRKSGRYSGLYIDRSIRNKIVKLYVHKKAGEWVETYQDSSQVVGVAIICFQNMQEMEADMKKVESSIQVIVEDA